MTNINTTHYITQHSYNTLLTEEAMAHSETRHSTRKRWR